MIPYCPMMYRTVPYIYTPPIESEFEEEWEDEEDIYRSYEVETILEEDQKALNSLRGEENSSNEELKLEDPRQQESETQYIPGYPGYFPPGTPGIPRVTGLPGAPGGPGIPGVPGGYVNPAEIVRIIEFSHPDIIRTMAAYRIPLPEARRLIRRIARVTLNYCR